MGKLIRVIVALVVIVGVAFWAIDSVRHRNYSGSNISFKVGSGSVVLTNRGQEPLPARMRTVGRALSFRIESAELGLAETAQRHGTGRNTYYAVNFEVPPGQAEINVTRGSDVYFISDSNQHLEAVVKPKGTGGVWGTLIFAGLVILGALYYISRTWDHRWIGALRDKLPGLPQSLKGAT